MPIQQNLTNGILTRYERQYRKGADAARIYDQLAGRMQPTTVERGTTIQAFELSDMIVRPTAATANMLADFDPQTIDDAVASITVDMYYDGLKSHQKVNLTHFDNMSARFAKAVGKNMMETVDALARRAATEGTLVFYPGTEVTRATLSGATAGSTVTDSIFTTVGIVLDHLDSNKFVDGTLVAIMDPWAYADLLLNSSGNLITVAKYTEWGKKIMLDNELGMLNGYRIIKHNRAKTFFGAGAVRTSSCASTLNGAIKAGDKTCVLASGTNLVAGQWLNIGTAQSGAATDATEITEAVYVTNVSTNTVTFIGTGPFNGCKYDHADGAAATNKWSVHPIVFGGVNSLVKAFNSELGEYGQMVPPFETGNAKQWTNWSWKWFGGYARLSEGWLARVEASSARA